MQGLDAVWPGSYMLSQERILLHLHELSLLDSTPRTAEHHTKA